jgi:serine/threonine protein phosphatase PrpC
MSRHAASGWLEKRSGAGEDAQPIAVTSDAWMLAAVFDGMGGSGAKTYTRKRDGSMATGAALGAETAAAAVQQTFTTFAHDSAAAVFERRVEQAIRSAFETLPQSVESQSRLSGSLMLEFPTTACILLLRREDAKGVALWVGDSLAFSWSGSQGLKLLTWAGAGAHEALSRIVRADGHWADAPNPMAISADQRRVWGFAKLAFDLCWVFV